MRHLLVLSAFVCVLLVPESRALAEANTLALSLASDGPVGCTEDGAPYSFVPVFLLLIDPTMGFIDGFECKAINEGLILQYGDPVFPAGGVNSAAGSLNFRVHYENPLLASRVTLLATIPLLVADDLFLDLGPADLPDHPQTPRISLPQGSQIPLESYRYDDNPYGKLAINPDWGCTRFVPAQSVTWGSVKSLFR